VPDAAGRLRQHPGDLRAITAGALAGDCGIDLDLDGEVDNLVNVTATTAATTPQDQNPEDYKRVVTLVRWAVGAGSRFALQSTTLPNPGLSGAPRVTDLTASSALVTSPTVTSLSFTAQTNRAAEAVGWLLDGTPKGAASGTDTTPSAGPGASVPVGGHVAQRRRGRGRRVHRVGQGLRPVRCLRARRGPRRSCSTAAAVRPAELQGGDGRRRRRGRVDSRPERDIQGFRVYRRPPSGSDVQVADIGDSATEAQDGSNLPGSGNLLLLRSRPGQGHGGNLRTGDATSLIPIRSTIARPTRRPT
jgi:hypothetical protein